MLSGSLALGCRFLAASVFVLTASWKLTHRLEFEASFERLSPGMVRRATRLAVWPLAGLELAIAAALVAGVWVGPLDVVVPAVGCVVVLVFTLALAVGEEGGCGCWTTPVASPRALRLVPILRNVALLMALAAVGALSANGVSRLSASGSIAPVLAGILLALLIVEAPQIVAVATYYERSPATEGRQ